MPKRIQRKRTRGWKMPENTVYVGRGSRWGNPFRVVDGNNGIAISRFNDWLKFHPDSFMIDIALELKGKDLACWCPLDQPCHADILLEIANS